jgi:hypothetical protein
LRRHGDHDPSLICRPALGYGLCEVLPDGVDVKPWREALGDKERSDEETPGGGYDVWGLDFGVEGGKA